MTHLFKKLHYSALVLCLCIACSVPSVAQLVEVNKIAKEPFSGKAQDILYKTAEGNWWFQSFGPNIVRTVFRPFNYTAFEQVSNAVVEKAAVGALKVSSAPSYTIEFDNNIRIVIQRDKLYYKLGNDVKLRNVGYTQQGSARGFRFMMAADEAFYGGGERATEMNKRGQKLELYNAPAYGYEMGASTLNFSVPMIISSHGYAIFFDNASKGSLDIGNSNPDQLNATFTSGDLNFYIIFGKNTEEILQHYSRLTGRQPLPPRWALGNFLSRFGYRGEQQVNDIVEKMRSDKFPVDALVFDLFWFGDSIRGGMGNFDWMNRQRWPDPKKMLTKLQDQNIQPILISEPFVVEKTKNFAEASPLLATTKDGAPYILNDFYFGPAGLVDIFRRSAQDFMWKLYSRQIQNGAAGWWVDLTEPETHPADMFHNVGDLDIKRSMSADEVHNVYAHYWSKMLFERYAREYPQVRLFNLNRSGFAGSQRYSVFPWTGDVKRSWSGLQAQLPVLQGMSISGIPFVHSDAGGFTVPESKDNELYTRWLQFAVFTPIFRPHATALDSIDLSMLSVPPEPVFYDDPFKSYVRNAVLLRYRLLPYNYSLAFEQAAQGEPLMRPMNYYNFSDTSGLGAGQYYWGDQILVSPVTEKGQQSKRVYLPAGNWYDLHTGKKLVGGNWIDQQLSIENIPAYVRGGSILPMWEPLTDIRSTADYNSNEISLTYYPANMQSKFVLFDDDGTSAKSLEKGDFELITFTGNAQRERVSVGISSNNPDAYKRRRTRTFTIGLPAAAGTPTRAFVANKPVEVVNGKVKVAFEGKPVTVEIEVTGMSL